MSLYNMINGVQPGTFFFLPMLGDRHPNEWPRFRDCFAGRMTNDTTTDEFGIPQKKTDFKKEVREISVYTRVGGGNREDYRDEIDKLRKMPTYITDYDDDFDSTFATFVFSIPKKWHKDFDKVIEGKLLETSPKYQQQVDKVFPKLKGKLPWHPTPKATSHE